MAMTKDLIKRWLLHQSRVRGAVVSLDDSWQQVVGRHDAPPAVLRALGELTAAGLLLASTIKFDGFLTLQIQGDGPVSLMVVDCEADGAFRSTYRLADQSIEAIKELNSYEADGSLGPLVNVHGKGRFAVTIVPRDPHQQSYQGIVAFDGDTVADILQTYMERSEQLPTRIYLGASKDRAVGLMLQQMPLEGGKTPSVEAIEKDQDDWELMTHLAGTVQVEEMLSIPEATLMRRLYWEQDLRVLQERATLFRCQCNRHKVASMLQMLGQKEVESIIAERSQIKVNCEYCNNEYVFDRVDAAALFNPDGTPADLTTVESLQKFALGTNARARVQ